MTLTFVGVFLLCLKRGLRRWLKLMQGATTAVVNIDVW